MSPLDGIEGFPRFGSFCGILLRMPRISFDGVDDLNIWWGRARDSDGILDIPEIFLGILWSKHARPTFAFASSLLMELKRCSWFFHFINKLVWLLADS